MKNKIRSSEITPEALYTSRRRFIKSALKTSAASFLLASCSPKIIPEDQAETPDSNSSDVIDGLVDDQGFPATSYEDIASYTNFYEFSTDKTQPTKLAEGFITSPWTVRVDGFVNNPQVFDIDEIKNLFEQEERIYRMRCVEA
jgi:sulfoxide reductase catalytic subunit YedY